jgi:predicted enzyme related to lactoylglutathione lyase
LASAGTAAIAGIDHLVVLVDDLDAAAQRAAAAGFTVTPRSAHSKLGTANHCLMFAAGDYLELMGFVEDSPHLPDLRAHLAECGPGPAAIALRTDDAAADFERLQGAGLEPEPPLDFGRPVTLPTGEAVELTFRIVRLPAAVTVGPPLFLCEHRTREHTWHPGWLTHANGTQALAPVEGVAATAAELADLAAFYRRVFGTAAVDLGKERLTVRPRVGAAMAWEVGETPGSLRFRLRLGTGPP